MNAIGRRCVAGCLGALFVLSLRAAPCFAGEEAPATDKAPAGVRAEQGLRGKVVKLEGDFMPWVGDEPRQRNKTTPLQVSVHIFKGSVKVFENPDEKHPSFLQKVQTKADGSYECALPPGEYTAVAEINGKLYLNAFQSDGTWSTVTIEAKQWKTWDIRDSSDAAF